MSFHRENFFIVLGKSGVRKKIWNDDDDIVLTQNPLKVFVNGTDKGNVLKLSSGDLTIDVPNYKPTAEELSNWVTEKFPKYVKLLAKLKA